MESRNAYQEKLEAQLRLWNTKAPIRGCVSYWPMVRGSSAVSPALVPQALPCACTWSATALMAGKSPSTWCWRLWCRRQCTC